MKRVLLTLAALSMTFALAGCSSKKEGTSDNPGAPQETPGGEGTTTPPGTDTRTDETRASTEWKLLKLVSNCDQGEPEACTARYGFTVLSDGSYQIGPGPQGETFSGRLEVAEFKSVSEKITETLGAIRPQVEVSEQCISAEPAKDSKDLVSLSRSSGEEDLIRTQGTEFCFKRFTADSAAKVHDAIRGLAKKYYRTPFPDACTVAALKVEQLYAPLQACQEDKDCAYIDNTYGPVDEGKLQFIFTDDCSVIRPLSAGHATKVAEAQAQLQEAREATRAVCGAKIARAGCSEPTGFQNDLSRPVCLEGACRVNPSLGTR
jgi:hypothetical protein